MDHTCGRFHGCWVAWSSLLTTRLTASNVCHKFSRVTGSNVASIANLSLIVVPSLRNPTRVLITLAVREWTGRTPMSPASRPTPPPDGGLASRERTTVTDVTHCDTARFVTGPPSAVADEDEPAFFAALVDAASEGVDSAALLAAVTQALCLQMNRANPGLAGRGSTWLAEGRTCLTATISTPTTCTRRCVRFGDELDDNPGRCRRSASRTLNSPPPACGLALMCGGPGCSGCSAATSAERSVTSGDCRLRRLCGDLPPCLPRPGRRLRLPTAVVVAEHARALAARPLSAVERNLADALAEFGTRRRWHVCARAPRAPLLPRLAFRGSHRSRADRGAS